MTTKSDLIALRPMVDSDKNFVLATMLRGLYYGNSWFSEIEKSVFMGNYHRTLERLLAKDTTQVLIACLKDDTDIILGYSVLTPTTNVAHYVHVKPSWRGIGIARSLVPDTTKYSTHTTSLGLSILKKKSIAFNPFLL